MRATDLRTPCDVAARSDAARENSDAASDPFDLSALATAPDGVEALEQLAGEWLRIENGRKPRLDALLGNGYEALRTCLPPEPREASHGELDPHRGRTH